MFKTIEATDELVSYALAQGTPAERELKLSPSLMAKQFDNTMKWMLALQAGIAAGDPEAKPYRPMLPFISAYWVIWQYVSHDISALRAENEDLRQAVEDLRERLRGDRADAHDELASAIARLDGRINSLEIRQNGGSP